MWLSQSSSTGPSVVSFLNVHTEKKAVANAMAIDCHGWWPFRAATASAIAPTRSPMKATPTAADRIHPQALLLGTTRVWPRATRCRSNRWGWRHRGNAVVGAGDEPARLSLAARPGGTQPGASVRSPPPTSLGRGHAVDEEHGPGHRADAADPGREPAGVLGHVVGHVGHELLTGERHPGGHHGRTRLHHVGGDEAGAAGGGDEDVGRAAQLDHPLPGHARVHHGHGGVGVLLLQRQQVGQGPADGEAAAHDHHVAAGDRTSWATSSRWIRPEGNIRTEGPAKPS